MQNGNKGWREKATGYCEWRSVNISHDGVTRVWLINASAYRRLSSCRRYYRRHYRSRYADRPTAARYRRMRQFVTPVRVRWKGHKKLSYRRVTARCVLSVANSNLANYHATVQKLLIRQVLTKPMVWSWGFSWRQCVINKPTTAELCISPVYRRLAVAKFSKSTM